MAAMSVGSFLEVAAGIASAANRAESCYFPVAGICPAAAVVAVEAGNTVAVVAVVHTAAHIRVAALVVYRTDGYCTALDAAASSIRRAVAAVAGPSEAPRNTAADVVELDTYVAVAARPVEDLEGAEVAGVVGRSTDVVVDGEEDDCVRGIRLVGD